MTPGFARPASRCALLPALVLALSCAGEPSADPPAEASVDPLRQPHLFRETAPDSFRVRFATTEGDFVVAVRREWAPRGADRFWNLARAGFWDGVPFHRVLEGFTAGFGIHPDPWVNAAWRQTPLQDDPVRVSNTRGRLSFAKGRAHSRTVQVFVNLADNPDLDDQGFAPFAEVVEGMEVIDALHAGYGDGPPRGDGVYQAMAIAKGEEYFADFPELDRIESATVVEGVPSTARTPS